MTTSPAARALVERLFAAALAAVEPAAAVDRFFAARPDLEAELRATPGRLWLVGAGKAGAPMAAALVRRFGPRIAGGLVIVRELDGAAKTSLVGAVRLVVGGHPLIDDAGVAAAREIAAQVTALGPDDRLLVVISGGASALLSAPQQGVSVDDLRATGDLLLASGAPIDAVNAIRKHLDQLKGGRLAALAAPAPTLSLVISDVIGDPLPVIGSGPTVADPTTYADAWAALAERDLLARVPAAVREHLRAGLEGRRAESIKAGDPRLAAAQTALIAGARTAAAAMVAAARAEGLRATLVSTSLAGEAREVGARLAARAIDLARGGAPAVEVFAGETTVTLEGAPRVGAGGRNQECALAAALALEALDAPPAAAVASLASDGSDGPTDAAGAIVDRATCARARASRLDPARALAEHDAYPLLAATGDLVRTGPTATNVADLMLVLSLGA